MVSSLSLINIRGENVVGDLADGGRWRVGEHEKHFIYRAFFGCAVADVGHPRGQEAPSCARRRWRKKGSTQIEEHG